MNQLSHLDTSFSCGGVLIKSLHDRRYGSLDPYRSVLLPTAWPGVRGRGAHADSMGTSTGGGRYGGEVLHMGIHREKSARGIFVRQNVGGF